MGMLPMLNGRETHGLQGRATGNVTAGLRKPAVFFAPTDASPRYLVGDEDFRVGIDVSGPVRGYSVVHRRRGAANVTVAIEFRCGTCGKLLRTGEENAGRPAACPACGDRVEVPVSEGEAGAVLIRNEPPDATPRSTIVREHRGGVVLAFGILSWISMCFLFGVAAWALGVEDLRAMRAGEMDPRGERLTRAGMILGMISVVLALVTLLGLVAIAGIAIVFG